MEEKLNTIIYPQWMMMNKQKITPANAGVINF
jgi:hypothetical protein